MMHVVHEPFMSFVAVRRQIACYTLCVMFDIRSVLSLHNLQYILYACMKSDSRCTHSLTHVQCMPQLAPTRPCNSWYMLNSLCPGMVHSYIFNSAFCHTAHMSMKDRQESPLPIGLGQNSDRDITMQAVSAHALRFCTDLCDIVLFVVSTSHAVRIRAESADPSSHIRQRYVMVTAERTF